MTVQSILQSGFSIVVQEVEALGMEALTDLEQVIEKIKQDLVGNETAEQVVTDILNLAESLGLQLAEKFATSTLSAIAALLLKAV